MFELPPLPYDYNALEPHVDEATMIVHHDKHHQGYTDKLNKALEGHDDLQSKSIEELLTGLDSLPDEVKGGVRNNGGGYFNHLIFWNSMSPDGGGELEGALSEAINEAFGDFNSFKEQFSAAAGTLFGSGWTWLVKDSSGKLSIMTTPNQDCPLSKGLKPLLALDVWEHAYYLKYQNRRPEFIEAWWNVVNWKEAEKRYSS